MGSIRLEAVEKWFGDVQVIKGIDLQVEDGEFVIFVGPSGCGKSTLLRMIAGLEDTSRGRIYLDEKDVTDRIPSERELSMVFQSYALYPHMTVGENIGFGLKTAGKDKTEIISKVNNASSILELDDYLDRKPKALSGGQRQRVAIGRAIVREPKGFLFDEPLSNLDASLRVQMRFEIAKLHKRLKTTMVYVTHDQVEAMTLADKIVVLKDGLVMQVGTPRELFENPANLFVAQFIGSPKMNILPCEIQENKFSLPMHNTGVHGLKNNYGTISGQIGIRPEHITIGDKENSHCSGIVEVTEYLGSDTYLYVSCKGIGNVVLRISDYQSDLEGKEVNLNFAPNKLHFFDNEGLVVT